MRQQHSTAHATRAEAGTICCTRYEKNSYCISSTAKVLAFVKLLSYDGLFLTPQFASASTTTTPQHMPTPPQATRLFGEPCSIQKD